MAGRLKPFDPDQLSIEARVVYEHMPTKNGESDPLS